MSIRYLNDINVASALLSTDSSNSRVYVNNPTVFNSALNVNGKVQASSGFTVNNSGVTYGQYGNNAYIYAPAGSDINLGGGIGNIQNDVIIGKGQLYISASGGGTPADALHIKDVAANIRLESTSSYPNQKIDFRSSTASKALIENNEFNAKMFVGRTTGAHVDYYETYQTLRAGGTGTHYITIGATETKISANLTGDATEVKLQDYSFQVKVNYTQAFYVGSGGSVDIGLTSQVEKLNFSGNIYFPNNNFLKTNIPAGGSGFYTRIHGINSSNVEYIGSVDATTAGTIIGSKTNYLSLRTDESEAIRIDSNQQVGIGTNNPSAILHVNGQSGLIVGDGNEKGLSINNGTYIYKIGDIDGGENQSFIEIDSANEKTIFNNTNVGIGVTSPSDTLHIAGTVLASSTMTASNFILSSDEKLKENIKDLNQKPLNVKWRKFELKSEPGVHRVGVIAQELEKTNPEFVREDKDGLKSVAYIDLLITKIAELEARLEKAGL